MANANGMEMIVTMTDDFPNLSPFTTTDLIHSVTTDHVRSFPIMKLKLVFSLFAGVLLAGFVVGCASTSTQEAKAYPLQTCLVSDEKLDGHGEPFVFVHNGQQIKMCCEDCMAEFKKDPDKYLAKLQEAK